MFVAGAVLISVEQIGDFCNPNPVQNFHWVIRSDPNPVDLSKYLIQSSLYPKNSLIKHYTAVMNAVWISTSDPVEFFRNPVQSGSGSELQNPVGSRSWNRIIFNTAAVAASGPTRWTSTYGLEPVLCNKMFIEPSGWAQTVHMFTQRFT